ncbi:MAG: nucleotidyltransferase family protein [Lachnospiraceae bacterium]|nr:nucleotidyltransferase family protein [Lachnospiraceae bacterium]
MNVVGIIAEYNPFHKGHAYHIAQAKARTGSDYAVVLMSPDFVQRGEPAVTDKYTRARMALLAGADCVLEMPVCTATGAARTFAQAGVALLEKTGVVTHLSFGSECGDLSRLLDAAELLAEEPEAYSAKLQESLKNGLSYPAASSRALAGLSENAADLTASPNNLLALEYLKAILLRRSPLIPDTVPRIGDYTGTKLAGAATSAGAIRRFLETVSPHGLPRVFEPDSPLCDALLPETISLYRASLHRSLPVFPDDFSSAFACRLLCLPDEKLLDFEDVSEDLAKRILRERKTISTFTAFAEACKSRSYTRTRINRALIHILLDVRKKELFRLKEQDYGGYLRILGFRSGFRPVLSEMKRKSPAVLLTKTADAPKRLSPEDYAVFEKNVFASDIYRAVVSARFRAPLKNEYTQGLILLP